MLGRNVLNTEIAKGGAGSPAVRAGLFRGR
jgi:hypothetical protein